MSWIFVGQEKFYLHDNETLLTGLQRVGFTPNFECCQGYCGTCKLKIALQNGEIYHNLPPLCYLEDNEVLACCCKLNGTAQILSDCPKIDNGQLSLFDTELI